MAVEYSREGSVGYITLDNPPANSYDLSFMEELSGRALRGRGRRGRRRDLAQRQREVLLRRGGHKGV